MNEDKPVLRVASFPEVELSVGPFSMNPERNAAVHLTYPILFDFETILLPRPKLENDVGGFLKPFPLTVWLLILCSLIVTSMMLMGFEIISKNIVDLQSDDIFTKAFMFTLTTITVEGSTWLPSMHGGRVLAAAWLVAITVLISAYSGILVAMLTLPRTIIPVDSLEDLVHQNKIPWKLSRNTHFTRLLQSYRQMSFVHGTGKAELRHAHIRPEARFTISPSSQQNHKSCSRSRPLHTNDEEILPSRPEMSSVAKARQNERHTAPQYLLPGRSIPPFGWRADHFIVSLPSGNYF
ncbi:ionotropic receptor 25a-like isoform X2 [Macrobrachium nipponense]|uniref:ionotropic receptor 25a-like isoform X2 n=1 Tax=Macrobrachium nipponense TaxID=159736 RepID=UPI0030C7C185